ncbi:MAG TPA: TIGR02569 family protein [Amycolatopsis sp.]|uniref:TIGR02569 family protein n=1 Tax=Amycolatopsis sp. TaxID=37632 RepID=UPI002B48CDB2|nr:TIGR02569 family protein [Amycolatopsis sp.]HKS44237.1 TIGR02569 family protein [Amycolatopsis sp.]
MVVAPGKRENPPERVRAAFGVDGEPERLPGTTVWRCGGIVLKPVVDRARSVWLARTLLRVDAPDLRIARPVRATDGRLIVGGWAASRYLPGSPEHRHDEIILAALKLAHATADEPRPGYRREDIDALADRIAWEEVVVPIDETKGGRWFEVLAVARRPVRLPNQVVPGDLFGAVLFDGPAAPGIVDFEPYYRPAEWGAAIAAVDAISWGGAEVGFLRRWSHLPAWSQLLLRALLFRLAGHALNPRSTPSALDGLRGAASAVSEVLSSTGESRSRKP